MKRIAFVEGFIYLAHDDNNILKISLEGEVIASHCDEKFLQASAPEQELSNPEIMALGIIGEGCGGNRVFIANKEENAIDVVNLEDSQTQRLIENISAPDGISKVMCTLYISSTEQKSVTIFNLSSMTSYSVCYH